ncbi:MAG: hypothetical protein RL417_1715 [Pseudomonadota bacterium]
MFRTLSKIALVALLVPALSFAQIASVQSGNWSSPATWSGGIVPSGSSRATVNHAVVVDRDTTIGASPAAGAPAIITVEPTGSLTVSPGIKLAVRGDIALNDAPMTLVGNSVLEFDASQAAIPAAARYALRIGTAHDQGAVLRLQGTNSARCAVRSVGTNNGAAASITGGDFLGAGIVQGAFCDLTRIGDAANPAILAAVTGASEFSLTNVSFNGGGELRTRYAVSAEASFTLKNTTFKSTQSPISAEVNLYAAPATGKARIVEGNVFDKPINFFASRRAIITDNVFLNAYAVSPDDVNEGWDIFDRNFILNRTTAEKILAADSTNNYWLTDLPAGTLDYNPHFVQALTWRSSLIDGDIFEYTGDDENGDCIGVANPTAPKTLTIRNCIVLPNGAGSTSGTLFSALGGPNAFISAEHNTYIAGIQGTSVGETYPGHTGMVTSFKSNIAWDTAPRGYVMYDSGPNETVPDLVGASALDYNTGYKLIGNYADLEFSVGTPGIHDVNVDPQFVDPARDIAAWDKSLGGPGTAAHAVGELAKRNDPSGFNPNYTVERLRLYVREGFRPRNTRLLTAAHDGKTIGAVAAISVVTPVPTPSPTPGVSGGPRLTKPKVSVKGRRVTVTVPLIAASKRFTIEFSKRGRIMKTVRTTRRTVVVKRLGAAIYKVRYRVSGIARKSPYARFRVR